MSTIVVFNACTEFGQAFTAGQRVTALDPLQDLAMVMSGLARFDGPAGAAAVWPTEGIVPITSVMYANPAAYGLNQPSKRTYEFNGDRIHWRSVSSGAPSNSWSPVPGDGKPPPLNLNMQRRAMVSPPTVTFGTTATVTGKRWYAAKQQQGLEVAQGGQHFTFYRNLTLEKYFDYIRSKSDITSSAGVEGVGFFHTGTSLEIIVTGNGTGGTGGSNAFNVKVDGEYVSLTPQSSGSSADTSSYYAMTFPGRARRRIDIIGLSYFGGVNTGATDSIQPAPVRGRRVVMVGDSQTGGSLGVAGPLQTIPAVLADMLGFDSVVRASEGGSGYLANVGQRARFRIAAEVLPYDWDDVILAYGRNDGAFTYAELFAEVDYCIKLIRNAKPLVQILVTSPIWACGPMHENWLLSSTSVTKAAIRDAALANGVPFIDLMNPPLPAGTVAQSATTQSAITIGATTFSTPIGQPLCPPLTVQFANGEQVCVRSISGNVCTLVGAFKTAHAAGEALVQVGDPPIIGTGNSTGTTGDGNADTCLYGGDQIHYTPEGCETITICLANHAAPYLLQAVRLA